MLNGLLGAGEDAHELYFNLIGTFTSLSITASNAPTTAYGALVSPMVSGGAGSSFDFGVNLGNGGGGPGNGALTLATFPSTIALFALGLAWLGRRRAGR